MPLTLAFSHCGAKLRAPDNAAGKSFKCPKCGKQVTVTAITEQPAMPPLEIVEPLSTFREPNPAIAPVVQPVHEEDTKVCPFCAETIRAAAKKCKHCGEIIDVTLRAVEEVRRTAEKKDAPAVYMNSGGGGGASSAASSSAAVSSAAAAETKTPSQERVRITMLTNWLFLGIAAALAVVLGVIGIVLLYNSHFWAGIILLVFAGGAVVGPWQRSFNCSACEKLCATYCFTPAHKCEKCGLIHVIKWE